MMDSPAEMAHEQAHVDGCSYFEYLDDLDRDSGSLGTPCSLEFLQAMRRNIHRLYRYLVIGFDCIEDTEDTVSTLEEAIPAMLDEMSTELKRLLDHPELHPAGASQWFLHVLKWQFRAVLDHLVLEQDYDEEEQLDDQDDLLDYLDEVLPQYDQGRTVWQQFLHAQAPGSGLSRGQMLPKGCTQMVTVGCALVTAKKRHEQNRLKRALEDVSSQSPLIIPDCLAIIVDIPKVCKHCQADSAAHCRLEERNYLIVRYFLQEELRMKDTGVMHDLCGTRRHLRGHQNRGSPEQNQRRHFNALHCTSLAMKDTLIVPPNATAVLNNDRACDSD
ncbi:MAG: hypothetical protein Q9218_001843 [Villophora microphyllina]